MNEDLGEESKKVAKCIKLICGCHNSIFIATGCDAAASERFAAPCYATLCF